MATSDPREIERGSWSQGIQTLISILIGAALAVAVGKAQEAKSIDIDFAIRLMSFSIYCVGFFWFYHKFYIFFYRRASIFSILLPSIVGSALIATAHNVNDQRAFWLWTFALIVGASYSTAITAISCWRGKYKVIDALPTGPLLSMFSATMLRSAIFLAVMACITGALLWGQMSYVAISIDRILAAVNGSLFIAMSAFNWLWFTKPLEKTIDS